MQNDRKLNIYESLAQEVSQDVDSARQFLTEEGIETDALYHEKMTLIISRISQFILEKGKINQKYLQVKYRRFYDEIKGLSTAKVIELYPPLAKTAFRELSVNDISEQDIQNLLLDGSFLTFLESYSNDDPR